jgi:hypothetical protein
VTNGDSFALERARSGIFLTQRFRCLEWACSASRGQDCIRWLRCSVITNHNAGPTRCHAERVFGSVLDILPDRPPSGAPARQFSNSTGIKRSYLIGFAGGIVIRPISRSPVRCVEAHLRIVLVSSASLLRDRQRGPGTIHAPCGAQSPPISASRSREGVGKKRPIE